MLNLLNGARILDLTSIVLGPYATQILGDLGAEVIKIEPKDGDLFRTVRPGRSAGMGAGFLNCNRNKASIAIDLKQPQGLEILRKMAAGADVLVHNMRPASARALGVAYEDMVKINPSLVYCYAPGFGEAGPYADMPAYDDIIQAMSGVAQLNSTAEGEPRFLPTIVCDKVGGLHLAISVLGGLVHRMRTGKGCSIQAPMFESMVSFLMVEQLAGQSFVPPLGPMGYERLTSPYRRPFPTADGYVAILPYNTAHWTDFFTLIGRKEVASEPRVVDPVVRSREVGSLYKIITEVTPSRTTAQWLEALRAIDVPCAPVNRMEDLLSDPHLAQIEFFSEDEHPSEGGLRTVRSPFSAVGVDTRANDPVPRLGEDSTALLRSAGYTAEEIQGLIEGGVVRTG